MEVRKKYCPLCGNENDCAVLKGEDASTCWCQQVHIAKELLAKIPEDKIGSCLCQDCVAHFNNGRPQADK